LHRVSRCIPHLQGNTSLKGKCSLQDVRHFDYVKAASLIEQYITSSFPNLRSTFKKLLEFAGIIYRNCSCDLEMYINILRRLRDAVRSKRPKKWKTDSRILLHDIAPVHRSASVKDLLAKNNVTTLEHPPYSPHLAPADSYLFALLKSALKGRCFCDVTNIIKNATEELKRLSQNGAQE